MTDANRKEKNTKVNTPDWPGDVKLIFRDTKIKGKMKHMKGVCQGVLVSL